MYTPYQTFTHLKETLIGYLETAYKLSHQDLFAERRIALENPGVIAQKPFIETTPEFRGGRTLHQIAQRSNGKVPLNLAELFSFGTPIGSRPLWEHQQRAIEEWIAGRNIVVATGTGSGKTEIFITPILARILTEAAVWSATLRQPQRGMWDRNSDRWLHCRSHETRQPGLRAILLYPTNALVNDQVRRFRRLLASEASDAWQRERFNKNRIYFGMYTSDTDPTGHWASDWKRQAWEANRNDILATWNAMPERLRITGGWPRLDGCEMLCRWDMQLAPPDILITNYSMLEYMLIRPIENPMFEVTRRYLRTPGARLTLVVDEAHTYRGARGTEIALLVRRLKERLSIGADDGKFEFIATSASLPARENVEALTRFAANLSGENQKSFAVISYGDIDPPPPHKPSDAERIAFANLARNFDLRQPQISLDALATSLNIPIQGRDMPVAVRAYETFANHPQIIRLRQKAARNATPIDDLATFLWENGSQSEKELATAGVLAVGCFSRPSIDNDAQPLISSRLHLFFRGLTGMWACMDPGCTEVPMAFRTRGTRPVGRIYFEPRVWCICSARVLEMFTCRVCGLVFLGGVPDQGGGGLWPWSDDLESGRQDYNDYEIFGVEMPQPGWDVDYRSTRTTVRTDANSPYARPVYPVLGTTIQGNPIPFPLMCPRCNTRRGSGMEGREIIEPLKTRGSKSFSVLVEDVFRLQPTLNDDYTNGGRKVLTFSDSRQDAAVLAGDLEIDHRKDLFRQVIFRALKACIICNGYGALPGPARLKCPTCGGGGNPADHSPIAVSALRERILALCHRARIDPTFGAVDNYFAQLTPVFNPHEPEARRYIDAIIRNEIAAADFGLEPMGLAAWQPMLPAAQELTHFDPLSSEETAQLLLSIVRLLAMEDILLPPTLSHQTWPTPYVQEWDRRLVVSRGTGTAPFHMEFKTTGRTRLARYVGAIASRLVGEGRLADDAASLRWQTDLENILFLELQAPNMRILVPDQTGIGFGISIDRFQLVPLRQTVEICEACAYVSASSLLSVCLRCGHRTTPTPTHGINNFYKRLVEFAVPGAGLPDPTPFKVEEHTAQINKRQAKNYERWFQNLFLPSENADSRRIDALSVTTTMEMGIDIGDLLSVGLRNIPPSVANYQQRAGRAGRRGNALATVVSFALQRTHDQYHYARPPRIISDPPRPPRLYLDNEVLAKRHVRGLVLQYFFLQWGPSSTGQAGGLMNAWGNNGDFNRQNGCDDLARWVTANAVPLRDRVSQIVPVELRDSLPGWIAQIPTEVRNIAQTRPTNADLLSELLNAGLLPRHAFPIDVVSLWTGREQNANAREVDTGIQRDLSIALSEFAPAAEVVKNKAIHRVVGLYDPYARNPNFTADEVFVECRMCKSIEVLPTNQGLPATCSVCGQPTLRSLRLVRPPGFCSDWSREPGGRQYYGGGRDRIGYAVPARLGIGDYSFQGQRCQFSPRLFSRVRVGQLHVVNFGETDPNQGFAQGFRICPRCGRALEGQTTVHDYPADIPPHRGPQSGPRAGQRCPNTAPGATRVVLGHRFPSEVILLGVDLPPELDADNRTASGRATWLSFGTILANAAVSLLDIDPDELRVGIRSVMRPGGRIHAEVFIHDTLPGGAGYAREIHESLDEILNHALQLSGACPNVDCAGACYSCLLDYRNQHDHPLLDRSLAHAVIEWVLGGRQPTLTDEEADAVTRPLRDFLSASVRVQHPRRIDNSYLPIVFEHPTRGLSAVLPIHTLRASPSDRDLRSIIDAGIHCHCHKAFDLVRRPFWVLNRL